MELWYLPSHLARRFAEKICYFKTIFYWPKNTLLADKITKQTQKYHHPKKPTSSITNTKNPTNKITNQHKPKPPKNHTTKKKQAPNKKKKLKTHIKQKMQITKKANRTIDQKNK